MMKSIGTVLDRYPILIPFAMIGIGILVIYLLVSVGLFS